MRGVIPPPKTDSRNRRQETRDSHSKKIIVMKMQESKFSQRMSLSLRFFDSIPSDCDERIGWWSYPWWLWFTLGVKLRHPLFKCLMNEFLFYEWTLFLWTLFLTLELQKEDTKENNWKPVLTPPDENLRNNHDDEYLLSWREDTEEIHPQQDNYHCFPFSWSEAKVLFFWWSGRYSVREKLFYVHSKRWEGWYSTRKMRNIIVSKELL